MLCSLSTGKSGSNWLDRLRTSKGFPAADNLNLDQFLADHHKSVSDSPPTKLSNSIANSNSESTRSDNKLHTADRSQVAETASESGDKEWFGIMTDVLCDLFNMGEPSEKISRYSRKKSTRKQTNPKFCDVSTTPVTANDIDSIGKDESVQAATASLHSDNNSNIGINAGCREEDVDEEKENGGGGGSDRELKGYSRSEVTVIDTSFEVWKFDKLVFRRKNVWKVRDKKGKSWTFGSKKRKRNQLESGNGNENLGLKKKAKTSISEFGLSKDSSGGDFILPSNDKPQDEKRKEVCKDILDDHSQVPRKRIQFFRSPGKSKKNSSSVILIKAIPTNKKCGRNLPKNQLKDTERQCKA